MIIAVFLNASLLGNQIHTIGTASQGYLSQGGQVIDSEKIGNCLLCLHFPIHISGLQAFDKLLWLNIYKLHLIGIIKYRIRNPLSYHHAGNRCHLVIQTFNMLYIDRGIHINAGIQKLLYILIPLGMPTSFCIGMRQFIHKDQLRMSCNG